MGFFSGSMTFECYRVEGGDGQAFGPQHLEILQKHGSSESTEFAREEARLGTLAGDHLFDLDFRLDKNVFGDALHFGIRIDTNQVPGAIRRAWLQLELASIAAEGRRPTKAERQEAKDAVEARCEEAVRHGQFLKMQQFPILWDAREAVLYCGASGSAGELCAEWLEQRFRFELRRLSAGRLAQEWATQAKRRKLLHDLSPSAFGPDGTGNAVQWWNGQAENYDYLGNEFLLWLWWYWDTQAESVPLPDETEVTGMFARTLALECPRGESGKGTVSAEDPTQLPEAMQAIRSGKLPRKAGLTLVRQGEQYDLTLQAETFAVSGAKIRTDDVDDDAGEGHGGAEDRLDCVRALKETVDLLFQAFCDRRIHANWGREREQIRSWLKTGSKARKPRT